MPPRKATEREMEKITSSYVLPEHFTSITEYSRRTGLAVSFREAGEYTLKRIEEGAGCKPHNILEKSIKESSILSKLYPDIEGRPDEPETKPADAIARFKDDYCPTALKGTGFNVFDALKGYIGAWDDDAKKLVGVYVTNAYVAQLQKDIEDKVDDNKIEFLTRLNNCITLNPQSNAYVLNLNFGDEEAENRLSLQDFQRLNSPGMFLTGDYDLHEMVGFSKAGKPHHILADSPEEQVHLGLLETYIDTQELPKNVSKMEEHKSERSVVQHGPQESYIAHMLREERYGKIVEPVARMSSGVAMCDRGQWYLFNNTTELREWYDEVKLPIKSTWIDDKAPLPKAADKEPKLISFSSLDEEARRVVSEQKRTTAPPKQKISEVNELKKREFSIIKTRFDEEERKEKQSMSGKSIAPSDQGGRVR